MRPRVSGAPWAVDRMAAYRDRAEQRAREIGCHVSAIGRTPDGPWTVTALGRERRVELRGTDLEQLVFESLDRYAAGADTLRATWRAGHDGLAHGHVGTPWTLCKLRTIEERLAYPERARCLTCVRALDTQAAYGPPSRMPERLLIAAYGGLPEESPIE